MLIRLIFGLVMLCGGASAQDSRLRSLDTAGAVQQWKSVGRLDVEGRGFCTATMIEPDLIVTAAHCLIQDGQPIDPGAMRFRAALRGGRFLAERAIRTAIIADGYSGENPSKVNPNDVALLELDRAIRLPNMRLFDIAEMPRSGHSVAMISYAEGRDDAPSLQQSCTTLGAFDAVSILSCDVNFGASGAPVMSRAAQPQLIGMIVAMAEHNGRRVAVAVDLLRTLPALRARLAQGEGMPRSSNRVKTVRPPKG